MSHYAELEQVLKAVRDCGQYGAIHSNAIGGPAVFTNFGWLHSMADFEQWPFRPAGERDWAEDFSHENGNYHNRCTVCEHFFLGHKRRVVCKACAALAMERINDPVRAAAIAMRDACIESLRDMDECGDYGDTLYMAIEGLRAIDPAAVLSAKSGLRPPNTLTAK